MRMLRTLEFLTPRVLVLALAMFLSVPAVCVAAPAAEDDDKPVPCLTCNKKGVVACDRHKKDVIEDETGVQRCSEIADCPKCHGTFMMQCPRCKNKPGALQVKAWEDNKAWLARMREIDTFLRKKSPVMHGESDHFILTYDIRKLPVGRKGFNSHQGMHLYLDRLEALFADVQKDLGAEDDDFLAKTHVMIWERQRDLIMTANKFCHQKAETKSFLIGAKPIFTIHYNKGFLHEEFELHQAVVHNVCHCLLSNVWDGIWPGTSKGGWVDAGYAHYYEIKYFGHLGGVRHYCYREGDTMVRFKFGKWEPEILKLVKRDEATSFLAIVGKNTDNLKPEEHMYAWSYVDFILKRHPEKFGAVVRLVKQKKPIAEICKEGLGMSPFQFEEDWKTFVRETYQLKPNKKSKR